LFRNIGSDGCLFQNKAVNGIFRYNRLAQISEPSAEESVSLEGIGTPRADSILKLLFQIMNIQINTN
jgi:hypothetical protein